MEHLEEVIKTCIHMGASPKQIYLKVFNIIDKQIDIGEVKHVLYCASYGGYGYSEEFERFLNQYQYTYENDREYIYPYIIKFAQSLNISIDEAIKRASGNYCTLAVEIVPKHREYIIHEYDGAEKVEILNDFV